MPTQLKVDPKKTAEEAKKKAPARTEVHSGGEATANVVKEKLTNNQITKAASDVFAKIKARTGINQKKVDAWKKSWLAMPKTKKKYEHLQDAPQVVGEELLAMSNDIVDFVQGKGGGHSDVFKGMKAEFSSMFKDPLGFFKAKLEKGKVVAISLKEKVQTGMNKAKEGAAKAKETIGKAKKVANKAKDVAGKAKVKAGEAKKMAGKAKTVAKKVKK